MCPVNLFPDPRQDDDNLIALRSMFAEEAIEFAIERLEPWEVVEFLKDFREGNLKSYPEFMAFLEEKIKGSQA